MQNTSDWLVNWMTDNTNHVGDIKPYLPQGADEIKSLGNNWYMFRMHVNTSNFAYTYDSSYIFFMCHFDSTKGVVSNMTKMM